MNKTFYDKPTDNEVATFKLEYYAGFDNFHRPIGKPVSSEIITLKKTDVVTFDPAIGWPVSLFAAARAAQRAGKISRFMISQVTGN